MAVLNSGSGAVDQKKETGFCKPGGYSGINRSPVGGSTGANFLFKKESVGKDYSRLTQCSAANDFYGY
jgi:hypothetical protein